VLLDIQGQNVTVVGGGIRCRCCAAHGDFLTPFSHQGVGEGVDLMDATGGGYGRRVSDNV
jgi:hypothetical protein